MTLRMTPEEATKFLKAGMTAAGFKVDEGSTVDFIEFDSQSEQDVAVQITHVDVELLEP